MAKHHIPTAERVALWRGWNQRCAYTGEPLGWPELEIDHIIPESLLDDAPELQTVLARLGLPADFDLNSFSNWLPVQGRKNRQKSAIVFDEAALHFYLNLARQKLPEINGHYEQFQRKTEVEVVLTQVLHLLEEGATTLGEVADFVRGATGSSRADATEPVVITISQVVYEFPDGAQTFSAACDMLEEQLLAHLRASVRGQIAFAATSERNGETLSLRVAAWGTSLDPLLIAIEDPWEVTDVAMWSDLYEDDPDDLYASTIMEIRRELIAGDAKSPFGLARCPECGSRDLHYSVADDHQRDERYFIVRCQSCAWGDWTQ